MNKTIEVEFMKSIFLHAINLVFIENLKILNVGFLRQYQRMEYTF